MAYTQDDLQRVRAAIAAGAEIEIQKGDKRVRYRSIAELLAVKDEIVRELQASSPRRRSRSIRLRNAGKGV
ncbi:phage head-tail joining protein [Caballeronia sp. LjRoot31]|uniref:phage head-tail joining protein n=1 Tax=Caballeronia sp. LjRoot31 TaxID=3342324 RepID=UPI003ECE7E01